MHVEKCANAIIFFYTINTKNKHKTPKVKKHKFAFRRTSFLARVDAKFSGIHKQTRVLHIPLTLFWLHLITRLALPKENAREESNARSTYGFLTLINSFTKTVRDSSQQFFRVGVLDGVVLTETEK